MKSRWNLLVIALTASLSLSSCGSQPSKQVSVAHGATSGGAGEKEDAISMELTANQKLSRTFGHLLARQLARAEDVILDLAEVAKGLQDELDCKPAPLTEAEYESKMAEVQKMAFERKSQENLSLAEKFLQENRKNEGVVEVEPSRLQYRIVKEGTGKVLSGKPSALLHYKGSFISGQVFSSSEGNKEPILLPLSQTIPGFAMGMQGMKEGEVRVLYIHPDLAYGTSGQLPPNSLLIFEISLIKADGVGDAAALTDEDGISAS